jgi:hypothetical protein
MSLRIITVELQTTEIDKDATLVGQTAEARLIDSVARSPTSLPPSRPIFTRERPLRRHRNRIWTCLLK